MINHLAVSLALAVSVTVPCVGAAPLEESNKLVEWCATLKPYAAKHYDSWVTFMKAGMEKYSPIAAQEFWSVYVAGKNCPEIAALAMEMRKRGFPQPDNVVPFRPPAETAQGGGSGTLAVPVTQSQILKNLGIEKGPGSKGAGTRGP